jgi:hypothetical protein
VELVPSADQVLVKRNGADVFDGTNKYLVGHKGEAIQIIIAEIFHEIGMVLIDLFFVKGHHYDLM